MHASTRSVMTALIAMTLVARPGTASAPRPTTPAAGAARAPRAVDLIESVPVESRLGNPVLRPAQQEWLEMISTAKQTLDIEEFYVSSWPGEPLESVLGRIVEAARGGVRVRLLIDASMYRTYPQPADSLGKIPGIEVRRISYRPIAGGVQHAKYFLVDGREAYMGSQNFDWRSLKHIHELGVHVRDPRLTAAFAETFEMDWRAAGEQMAGRDSSAEAERAKIMTGPRPTYPLRLVQAPGDTVELWPSYSPKGFIPDTTLWDLDAIVRRIDAAKREIVVQLLTYSTSERDGQDETIDAALRRAAARGVKVRLVVSDWEADGPRIKTLQSLSTVPNVEARLSTVPEWSGGYIPFARVEHCKYMVVDSLWTWVGTSNWEPGYFHSLRNLGVTMRNRGIAERARAIFEASWNAPGTHAVSADSVYSPKTHGMTPPPGKTAYGR